MAQSLTLVFKQSYKHTQNTLCTSLCNLIQFMEKASPSTFQESSGAQGGSVKTPVLPINARPKIQITRSASLDKIGSPSLNEAQTRKRYEKLVARWEIRKVFIDRVL